MFSFQAFRRSSREKCEECHQEKWFACSQLLSHECLGQNSWWASSMRCGCLTNYFLSWQISCICQVCVYFIWLKKLSCKALETLSQCISSGNSLFLKTIVGGSAVPSAQIVMRTVIFSFVPPCWRCWRLNPCGPTTQSLTPSCWGVEVLSIWYRSSGGTLLSTTSLLTGPVRKLWIACGFADWAWMSGLHDHWMRMHLS